MHLMRLALENTMLRITTEKKRVKTVLSVEGRLAGALVSTLEQCWKKLKAAAPHERFYVNLCGVSFIDAAGKMVLKEMHRQGGQLVAEGCLNQAIVKEIIGRQKAEGRSDEGKDNKKAPIIFYVMLLGLLLGASGVAAQGQNDVPAPALAPDDGLKLTLDKAVSLALKQNPTAQIAVLQAAEAVQDKNIARASLLPQADLQVSDSLRRINLQEQLGGAIPFPGIPGHVGPLNIFHAGPGFSAPVFDLTLWNRYRSARDVANASKATCLSTREQVILLVVSQ